MQFCSVKGELQALRGLYPGHASQTVYHTFLTDAVADLRVDCRADVKLLDAAALFRLDRGCCPEAARAEHEKIESRAGLSQTLLMTIVALLSARNLHGTAGDQVLPAKVCGT